jgi:hypothetical protein
MEEAVSTVAKELRLACRGEGLTPSWVDRGSGMLQAVVGSPDSESVIQAVRHQLTQPPSDKYLRVFGVALGLGDAQGESLTGRRAWLISSGQLPSVSEATLRRWEEKGATVLARRLLAASEVTLSADHRFADLLARDQQADSTRRESTELMRDILDELRAIHSILARRDGSTADNPHKAR